MQLGIHVVLLTAQGGAVSDCCLTLDSLPLTGLLCLATIGEYAIVLLQLEKPRLVDIHVRPPIF